IQPHIIPCGKQHAKGMHRSDRVPVSYSKLPAHITTQPKLCLLLSSNKVTEATPVAINSVFLPRPTHEQTHAPTIKINKIKTLTSSSPRNNTFPAPQKNKATLGILTQGGFTKHPSPSHPFTTASTTRPA
ncbi:hypothetical protein, partial [Rivihabitans pingtungensis]|uniref:hypothetical protein n=1 Tax=Rivihabitans pingtungensis TaxID=1054498 RepID=UPI002FD9C5CD